MKIFLKRINFGSREKWEDERKNRKIKIRAKWETEGDTQKMKETQRKWLLEMKEDERKKKTKKKQKSVFNGKWFG